MKYLKLYYKIFNTVSQVIANVLEKIYLVINYFNTFYGNFIFIFSKIHCTFVKYFNLKLGYLDYIM